MCCDANVSIANLRMYLSPKQRYIGRIGSSTAQPQGGDIALLGFINNNDLKKANTLKIKPYLHSASIIGAMTGIRSVVRMRRFVVLREVHLMPRRLNKTNDSRYCKLKNIDI